MREIDTIPSQFPGIKYSKETPPGTDLQESPWPSVVVTKFMTEQLRGGRISFGSVSEAHPMPIASGLGRGRASLWEGMVEQSHSPLGS